MSRINPAIQDGRAFTVFSSNCALNSEIQRQFNIKSEGEYRMFLQNNPEKVQAFVTATQTEPTQYHAISPCPSSSLTDASDPFSRPYL
jgi:hypothetical protein